MRRTAAVTTIALLLAGCASRTQEVAVAPPIAVPTPEPMPTPPNGAAAGLAIPQRLADGRFATPNTGVSANAAVWHLRAALNVAVLGCPDPDGALAGTYNRFLATQRTPLATAHSALATEYGTTDAFDGAMTRLYNYFALPPATAAFCDAAKPLLDAAAALPTGDVTTFATTALPVLDQPFVDFFARYDQYRSDLAAWQSSGGTALVRLDYDAAALAGAGGVTGGAVRTAGR